MKGCFGLIIKIAIVILAYIGFQTIGGVDFVKEQFDKWNHPSQDVLQEKAKKIADLSNINDEYIIDKTASVMDYHFVLAEHKATGQKIMLVDPKKEDILTKEDFKTGEVDEKIKGLNDKFQYQLIRLENLKITKKGQIHTLDQTVPYVKFEADTVNLPIGHISGIIGVAQKDDKNIILASMNKSDKYSQIITESFFKQVK